MKSMSNWYTDLDEYKSKTGRNTLFVHRNAQLLFDCFPRSKSTLILSNVFRDNTKFGIGDWKQPLRKLLHPTADEVQNLPKVACFRSPKSRFKSFLLSKIVNPHCTSILPLFHSKSPSIVEYLCCSRDGMSVAKRLNPIFKLADSRKIKEKVDVILQGSGSKVIADPLNLPMFCEFLDYVIANYKDLRVKDILKNLAQFVDRAPFMDSHYLSQVFLCSYDIHDYQKVTFVDDLELFSRRYKAWTGCNLEWGGKINCQPNSFYDRPSISMEDSRVATLQLCINSGYAPSLDAIFDDETADLHRQIYRKDYLVEEAFAVYNE